MLHAYSRPSDSVELVLPQGQAGVSWLPLNAFAQLTPQSLRLRVRHLACEIVFPAKTCVLAARLSPPVSRVLSVSEMTMFD